MKNLIFTTAIALNMLSGVESKDHYVVKPEIHRSESHHRPDVQAYNCKTCLIESDNTNVCLTYGANFKIGWKWDQGFTDDPVTPYVTDGYYNLDFKVYSEQAFGATVWIFLNKLLELDVEFELEDFDLGITVSFKYWRASKRSCFRLFTDIDNFLMILNMKMRFPQCYKDILSSFWCFDNWTGIDAKIIDKCELSSYEQIEILKYEIQQDDSKKYWVGSDEDKSDGCWPNFTAFSVGDSMAADMLDNFYMYVFDQLGVGPEYQ